MSSRLHMGLFFGLTLLISALLHFVLLRALPVRAASSAENKTSLNSVDFDIAEPAPPPVTRPQPESPPAIEPPSVPPKPLPRRSNRKAPRVPVADTREPSVPTPEPAQTPTPPVSAPPPAAAEPQAAAPQDRTVKVPRPLNLSARTAAMSTWQPEAVPQSYEPTQRSVADIEREASLALNQRLKPKAAAPRDEEAIELKCDASQRCEFHGDALDAVILPDGRYQIHEKLNIPMPMLNGGMMLGGGGPNGLPKPEDMQAARELNQAMNKQRSVKAERERFLKETETLRQERINASNKQIEADGARNFRKRLDQIWHAPAVSVEQKHRQLFELWDETSQDERGEAYRRILIEYIRLNLSEHSESGYSAAELAALNARRSGRELFAPYAN